MLHYVTGDILLSKAQAIAHGIAPNDHFDSGLALALRERWPVMAKDFRHFCQTTNAAPGTLWAWAGTGGVCIINLLTQEPARSQNQHPGKATTAHVNHALRELHKYITTEKLASLALPRLATGVGGLDWTEVKPLIEKHLGELSIPIYIYETYHAGQPAKEPGTQL